MRRHRRIRTAAALLALAVLACACTSGEDHRRAHDRPAYRPTGQMVTLSGRFGGTVGFMDVATGKPLEVALPRIFGSWESAWAGPHGRFYGMPLEFSASAESRLYLLGGGQPPRRVGPPIDGILGFQVTDGYAVAWGCPGVFLLDLSDPSAWRRVSGGCAAALSPDGRRLAYATASSLWVMDLPDGSPREVLRFADLAELRRTHIPHRSLDQMTWGDGGVAVAVGDSSQLALVIWRNDRPPVVDVLGRGRLGDMRWQPGGDLLAFEDYAPTGELLTLDARTGEERQLAMLGDVRGLAWSPDGHVVGASVSQNIVALVDPRIGRVGTVLTPGPPVAWLPGPP